MSDTIPVRWTTPAAHDLKVIAEYIAQDSAETARKIAQALYEAANSLDMMPNRGRPGRAKGTRELVVPGLPYIIVYRVTKTAVHVLHIYHGAREWFESGR